MLKSARISAIFLFVITSVFVSIPASAIYSVSLNFNNGTFDGTLNSIPSSGFALLSSMRSNRKQQIDDANHYSRRISQNLYSTSAIAISSLAVVNALALAMGVAFVVAQAGDIAASNSNASG